jgi:osmotically-inducible protein OsmY
VRLKGGLSDLDDEENAGAVAAAVPGVSDVVDELEIERDGRR